MIPAAADDVRTHPADWPAPGPIDLTIHDLPHASARMEWWYVNAHVTAVDGRPFSVFAAFFVVDTSAADAPEKDYSHFLTWGLVDADGRRHFPECSAVRTSNFSLGCQATPIPPISIPNMRPGRCSRA